MVIKNKIPNLRISAKYDGFNSLMEVIENYLGLYVMTCQPVEVVSYENGFVSVKPVLIRTNSTGEQIEITDNNIIHNVPMMKLSANGWKMNFKAKEGDLGLLIASKFDISNYKKNHQSSVVGSRRMFSSSDSFYLPLDWNTENEEGFVLENGETSLTLTENSITIKGDEVNINATTANIVADEVNIGGDGGLGVARIGDEVDLDTGLIKTGSSKVKAV